MNEFNVIAGTATLLSLLLAMWIYLDGRRKEAVENERSASLRSRLLVALRSVEGIGAQVGLIVSFADREETTKKELKHLAVSSLTHLRALQTILVAELQSRRKWNFGVPEVYAPLETADESEESETEQRQSPQNGEHPPETKDSPGK